MALERTAFPFHCLPIIRSADALDHAIVLWHLAGGGFPIECPAGKRGRKMTLRLLCRSHPVARNWGDLGDLQTCRITG
jgi:hypothetical protein